MRWLGWICLGLGTIPLWAQSECRSLQGMTLPAASIGLPTTGGVVTSAKNRREGGVRFCKVMGRIRPVDPAAQDIRFEVNLPERWNGKAVHFGGGSFDGYLGYSDGLHRPVVSVAAQATPLERGYATFGGDSGHHKRYFPGLDILNSVNASFATNLEERRNFAQDGLKKTHDAAVAVMAQRYGRRPSRMFFLGGSTGGREAYFVVQRWPLDYDGVLGAYAGWNQVQLDLQFIRVSQAMYAKGGFLPPAKTRLLAKAAMDACDAQDGLKDGIISNPAGCRFDPAVLTCSGKDSKRCLTPAELHTVEVFATEQKTAEPLSNGVQSIPGFNVLAGTDLTGSMGLLHHPERNPKPLLNSFYYLVGDGVLRYFVTGDPHFDALHFDTTTGGKYAADLLPQSEASDASNADLTAYARRGGKLILLHGTTDATIPTNATVEYYGMLQAKMPQAELDGFVRLYLIPGYGHGRGVFNAGFDALGVLDAWVDTGVPPVGLTVVDNDKGSRTRPMCVYPAWPKYVAGDVNAAASFRCAIE
jgi:hypothetical protein